MTKRFERIYTDVDVFCRDHNAKGISQLIERDDYDKIVDLLNGLHEDAENLKDVNTQCCNDYSAMRRDVLRYKEENEQLNKSRDELISENRHIKKTIQTMLINERTAIGKSVLKQLWNAIHME